MAKDHIYIEEGRTKWSSTKCPLTRDYCMEACAWRLTLDMPYCAIAGIEGHLERLESDLRLIFREGVPAILNTDAGAARVEIDLGEVVDALDNLATSPRSITVNLKQEDETAKQPDA